MAFIFSPFDSRKENEGVWIAHPTLPGDFCIARMGTEAQQAVVQEQLKRMRVKTTDDIPMTRQNEFVCRVFARSVVVDWRDVVDLVGTPVPYSEENAYAFLMSNTELRDWVQQEANIAERYYRDKVEEAKNN